MTVLNLSFAQCAQQIAAAEQRGREQAAQAIEAIGRAWSAYDPGRVRVRVADAAEAARLARGGNDA